MLQYLFALLLLPHRTKEAQEVYEKALFYDRNNPDIYYNVNVYPFIVSIFFFLLFFLFQ